MIILEIIGYCLLAIFVAAGALLFGRMLYAAIRDLWRQR
jgi:hypothetical protein